MRALKNNWPGLTYKAPAHHDQDFLGGYTSTCMLVAQCTVQ